MSDYTLDDLGKYLAPQIEDLQDGAEHDHMTIRELEAEVKRTKKEAAEFKAKAQKLEAERDALREQNRALVERLEDERNAR